jgi:hypothetical protein
MKQGKYSLIKAPFGFPNKTKSPYVLEHRVVYWQHYGVIPKKNEVIHHKNLNSKDNRIENLELMSSEKHCQLHGQLWKKSKIKNICTQCGIEHEVARRNYNYHNKNNKYGIFCSLKCSGIFCALRSKNIKKQSIIIHGTRAGYLKEKRRKLKPCKECSEANNAYTYKLRKGID